MKRTKNELLQSCLEQFEHIDSVNNNPTLSTTESLIMEIKEAINYTRCCESDSELLHTEVFNLANKLAINGYGNEAVKMHGICNGM